MKYKVSFTAHYRNVTALINIEVSDPSDDDEVDLALFEQAKAVFGEIYSDADYDSSAVVYRVNPNFSKINKVR